VRETDVEQAVVEVAAIRREWRQALRHAPHDDVEGVDDRYAEDEQGRGDLRGAEDRQHRKHRPDEGHAGRAEKETRRMEVEQQEATGRARERERHPRDERFVDLRQQRQGTQREGGDRRDPGRQSIEPVDEVERDVHPHDPEDGECDRDDPGDLDQPIAERIVHEVDAQPGSDDDGRDDEETEELPARAELEHVVDETQRHSEERRQRGEREARRADLLGDEEGMAGHAVDDPEREDRETERQRDREAARPRDRSRMRATPARHVEQAESLCKPADEWCDRGGKKECDKSRADEEEAGHSAER